MSAFPAFMFSVVLFAVMGAILDEDDPVGFLFSFIAGAALYAALINL